MSCKPRPLLCALILAALLTSCMITGKATSAQPWKPYFIRLHAEGGAVYRSRSSFSTRADCEAALSRDLLALVSTALFVRWGECRADGDHA